MEKRIDERNNEVEKELKEIMYCTMCGSTDKIVYNKQNNSYYCEQCNKIMNDYNNNKPKNNTEKINHPKRYNIGKIEAIEYIKDQNLLKGFCIGNVIKYISRAGNKDNSTELEDLKKAMWYLEYYIKELENKWN
jgi:ribosomal protein L37AE/L43A